MRIRLVNLQAEVIFWLGVVGLGYFIGKWVESGLMAIGSPSVVTWIVPCVVCMALGFYSGVVWRQHERIASKGSR